MNNKLDLQIFESRCDCLTKVLSSYREGLVILGLYGVKDFNNAYVVEELMEGIISLCEKIYSYLKINKSKTQYKSILGPSSISLLYKNIDNKLTKITKHAKRHFWLNDVCTCHGLLPSHSA